MGTVFSFDVRDADTVELRTAVRDAVESLHQADRIFSTYKPDSDVSRLGRGEITLGECDPLVAEVLAIGELAEVDGGGAFTLHPHGLLDPSAVVKGWAVERASDILRAAGSHVHLLNGGGDVQSCSDGSFDWRIAVADPRDSSRAVLIVCAPNSPRLAVATSGISERGDHIVDARGGDGSAGLLSVTVVGESLTDVDIAATTAFALGADAREWLESRQNTEGFAVLSAGGMWTTSGFNAYVVA